MTLSATPTLPAARTAAADPAPAVAVCSLHGGAGASTLAALLVHAHGAPAVLADVGGVGASLWERHASGVSLADAAEELGRTGALSRSLAAQTPEQITVIAGPPAVLPDCDVAAGMQAILTQAADRHRLVVVDCGTGQHPAQAAALSLCDRVVWVADLDAVTVGRINASLRAVQDLSPVRQYVAARGRLRRTAAQELQRVATEILAPIALLEPVADTTDLGAAAEQAGVGLDALLGELLR
jgi:hypothetical protein